MDPDHSRANNLDSIAEPAKFKMKRSLGPDFFVPFPAPPKLYLQALP